MDKYILLVEDNPDDAKLAMRAFEKADVINEIHIARDGESALDFLLHTDQYLGLSYHWQPAVVLLDLKIPKVDGFGVLRSMRLDELTKTTPVVMLTSSQEPGDVHRCYAEGANSYVCKPVSFKDLSALAYRLSQYWLRTNLLPTRIL